MDGRVAIITGASQGLGFAIAKKYLDAGVCGLGICARSESSLAKATRELEKLARSGQQVFACVADVSKPEAGRFLVDATIRQFGHIDILVNNAGVYGPKGTIETTDWQQWVKAIEINLFGSVLMCQAVLPHFIAQGHGKIVQLSGGGATKPLPRLSAYATSKAAIVRFIETLAEEVKSHKIDANAFAPGALNTQMLDEILAAGPETVGHVFYEQALKQKVNGGAPLDAGAELAVFLASASSDGISGKLISALWDPWASLPDHLDDLNSTDIYNLRRIVPEDRGKTWIENQ